jgi:subtilisin family serine protease
MKMRLFSSLVSILVLSTPSRAVRFIKGLKGNRVWGRIARTALSRSALALALMCSPAKAGVTVVQNISPGATNWPGVPLISTVTNPASASVSESFSGAGGNTNMSETFTVVATNYLLQTIDLYAGGGTGTGAGSNLTLNLYDLGPQTAPNPSNYTAAISGGNLLGSVAGLPISYYGHANGILELDFTGADQVLLRVGHMYAFELTGTSNSIVLFWQRVISDTYAGGAAYRNQSWINGNNARDFAMAVYALVDTNLPFITQQPQSLTVTQGQAAAFSVEAGGTPPLFYQWQFNATNILDATNAVLTIASAGFTSAGNYAVVVTNAAGSVTSKVAVLTVEPQVVVIDAQNPGWVRGRIVLQFTEPVAQQLLQALANNTPFAQLPFPLDIQILNQQYLAQGITQEHPSVGSNDQHLQNIFLLSVNPQADMQPTAAAYAASPEVVFAEPDYIGQLSYMPNDPEFLDGSQWGLTKVNASTAWDATDANSHAVNGNGIIVAVVDSGVDTLHCDLALNCVAGWDFLTGTSTVTDPHGHGTHIAGIIAAVGNNLEGVIGLAYGSQIMPLRAFDASGQGNFSDGADAIIYAVDHGAVVINCSWGATVPSGSANLEASINYAHSQKVLVVCAAGNNSGQPTRDFAPANAENAMAVSATDSADALAAFSNYGVKTDVAAPGTDILSTTPPAPTTLNNEGYPLIPDGGTGLCDQSYDMRLSGTSMAAPHVSALAALIWQLHPTWLPEEVKQTIRQSAAPRGLDADNGFDSSYGYGRIDAAAALAQNQQLPIASVTAPRNGAILHSSVNIIGEACISATSGLTFDHYAVQIAPGVDPLRTAFVTLGTSTTPASLGGGTLYPNLQNFANGTYTLRVVTSPLTGPQSEDRNEIQFTSGYITYPTPNQYIIGTSSTIKGVVPSTMKHIVGGSVVEEAFTSYSLSWRRVVGLDETSITPVNPGPFDTASTLVDPWDLTSVSEGQIVLKLTINYSGGLVVTDSVTVILEKLFKPGWPVAVNHRPSFKSPMAADLDGDGIKEIILGAAVFEPGGTVRPGWDNNPGLGRSNPAVVDAVPSSPGLEVIAAVFTAYRCCDPSAPNNGGVMIYCYPP